MEFPCKNYDTFAPTFGYEKRFVMKSLSLVKICKVSIGFFRISEWSGSSWGSLRDKRSTEILLNAINQPMIQLNRYTCFWKSTTNFSKSTFLVH